MSRKDVLQNVGLISLSVIVALFICEIVLQKVYPPNVRYYIWQPGLHATFSPDPAIMPGISGKSYFSINAEGFRGAEFSADAINYLCIGGSTTECLYLDDRESWHSLLQDSLRLQTGKPVKIGNCGKSGHTTRQHYITVKYIAPRLEHLDGLVLMVGFNDFMHRLTSDTTYEPAQWFNQALEDALISQTFLKRGRGVGDTWWRRTALFYLLKNVFNQWKETAGKHEPWENVQDSNGVIYATWRINRQSASRMVDTLPDLNPALDEFEQNLKLIHRETERQGLHLVLVNQSAIYKDSMSAYENSLLWMGGIGNYQGTPGQPYYSPHALSEGLDLYNERLKAFTEEHPSVTFIDLNAALPRDTSVFYDDCHFNESGAEMVAHIICNGMVNMLR